MTSSPRTPPAKIFKYTLQNLTSWWKERFGTELDNSKPQISYILKYIDDGGVKTVVVENEYVDHDFLEDFAEYYVRCFHPYKRYCSRLHFFGVAFEEGDFHGLLASESEKINPQILNDAYLGFVVVKPLPRTVVGRTCLKTGPKESLTKNFPTIRKYKVNFFGISLEINSLAFQEQDSVVAACATSALWSAFHATGELFHHAIPSPVEITKLATQLPLNNNRSIPNKEGLRIEQMAHAVRKISLEPFCVNARDESFLKSSIYAYLRAKIPVVLAICLYNPNLNPWPRHAVTITGFELGIQNLTSGFSGLLLTSSRINKIFVHDDGVGPFASMEFDGMPVQIQQPGSSALTNYFSLTTPWGSGYRACPEWVLIPVYNKIRITIEEIHAVIALFDQIVQIIGQAPDQKVLFEWEIYLINVTDLKEEIFNTQNIITEEKKRAFLLQNMPRFIWRAKARYGEKDALDLFFDATDIEQGELFFCALEYRGNVSTFLRAVFSDPAINTMLINTALRAMQEARIDLSRASQPTMKILEHFTRA